MRPEPLVPFRQQQAHVADRVVTSILLIGTFGGCSMDTAGSGPAEAEKLGTQSSGIWGGAQDIDTLQANTVVRIDDICTGTLITPRAVLTSTHCLVDNTNTIPTNGQWFITVGSDEQSFHRTVLSDASDNARLWLPINCTTFNGNACTGMSLNDAAHDVSVIWLADSIVSEALPVRPMTTAPMLSGATVWMAGWSPFDFDGGINPLNARFRTRASFSGSAVVPEVRTGGERLWHTTSSAAGGEGGDSGGPLFMLGASGERLVFGVLHGGPNVHTYHADITTAPALTWLNNTLLDRNHGGQRQQGIDRFASLYGQSWYAFHGKDPDTMWYGETDYVGPCQKDPQNPLRFDQDCDGWWDHHDTCPNTPNSAQVPGDEADIDADGVCDNHDNCRFTYNPDQINCNKEFEDSQLHATLGDACDPVPCPHTVQDPWTEAPHWNIFSDCSVQTVRLIADGFTITPVGPHKSDQYVVGSTPPAIPLPGNVDTTARFCQTVRVDNSDETIVDCTDDAVRKPLEQLVLPESTQISANAPWHRITLTDQAGTEYLPDGGGIPLHYADGVSKKVTWKFREDDARWHEGGTDVLGSNKPGSLCSTDRAGPGTCLDGWMWVHADTMFGSNEDNSTIDIGDVTHNLGVHGAGLSDTTFPVIPDFPLPKPPCQPVLFPCAAGDGGCIRDLYLDPDYCPNCGPVLSDLTKDKIRVPLVRASVGPVAMLWNDLVGRASEIGLPSNVVSAVSTLNFVSSQRCEATPDGAVSAIALPAGSGKSKYLVASSSSPGGFLVRDSAFSVASSGPSTDTARTARYRLDAKVVFPPAANGAFIVGGTTSGVLRTDVQFEPIDGPVMTLSGSMSSAASVLAATINGSELWTIERSPPPQGGSARIDKLVARTITTSTVSSPTYTMTLTTDSTPLAGTIYMLSAGCETAGKVVLSISNPTQNRWATFEVARGSVRPLVNGGEFEDGALFQAPRLDKDVLILPIAKANTRTPFVANLPRKRIITRPTIPPSDIYLTMR